MRSSKKARLTDFLMPLTALMIVSGLTSILTAIGIIHLPSFSRQHAQISSLISSAIICEALGGVKQSKWTLRIALPCRPSAALPEERGPTETRPGGVAPGGKELMGGRGGQDPPGSDD